MGREVFEKYEKLEAEIKREKAEALGKAGERLEEALLRLAELREAIEALNRIVAVKHPASNIQQTLCLLAQEYNSLRERALRYYQYLIIQREAVGFYDHREVERLYRVPDPIEEGGVGGDRGQGQTLCRGEADRGEGGAHVGASRGLHGG